jgi:hypothetical protein
MVAIVFMVALAAYEWRKNSRREVRPMVHPEPPRRVEITPHPASTTPQVMATPQPPASLLVTADGLQLGVRRYEVEKILGQLEKVSQHEPNPWQAVEFRRGSLRLFFAGPQADTLVAISDPTRVEVQGQSLVLHPGQGIELAALRSLLMTGKETQKLEASGSVRHAFPLADLQVQVWIHHKRIERMVLCPNP